MEINPKELNILSNWVLVKLNDDHDNYHSSITGKDTGIHVARWGFNSASHLALTGTIVQLPLKLTYHGHEIKKKRKEKMRSDSDQKNIAALRSQSLSYEVPMEVSEGDMVYFEYTTRLNAFKEGRFFDQPDGVFLLLPYDSLVLLFRKGFDPKNVSLDDVYPLNGFVLIKPLEYTTEKTADGVVGVKTESDIFINTPDDAKYVKRGNMGYASALRFGCMVSDYADFEKSSVDTWDELPVGTKIMYDRRQHKRLEVDHHRVIFKTHIFYRIHRKDVYCIFPDGNINGITKM